MQRHLGGGLDPRRGGLIALLFAEIAAGVSFCGVKNSWDKSTHDLQAARHSVGRKDLVPTRRPLSTSNHSQGGAQQLLHSRQDPDHSRGGDGARGSYCYEQVRSIVPI